MNKKAAGGQDGVALILALVILAVGASIASAMLWERGVAVSRSALVLHQQEAYQYDLGAETWLGQILRQENGQPVNFSDPWARPLPSFAVAGTGGTLRGAVIDLQSRFNLNDLRNANGSVNQAALQTFRRLLGLLDVNVNVADAVAAWVCASGKVQGLSGAQSGFYASLDPPYAEAHYPFVSVSSLRLVEGVTPEVFERLAPYITALPVHTAVNVNTASAPVIAAVVPGLSLSAAEAIVMKRRIGGFASVQTFEAMTQRKTGFPVTLDSEFFRLRVRTRIGNTALTLYSVLYRSPQGKTEPILRSFTP